MFEWEKREEERKKVLMKEQEKEIFKKIEVLK